jgi:tape measure domain-containing protein
MSAYTVGVTLDLDTGSFTGKLQAASTGMGQFGRQLMQVGGGASSFNGMMNQTLSVMHRLTNTIAQLRGALGNLRVVFVDWLGAVVKSNIELQRMLVLMDGLSKKTTFAERQQEALDSVKGLIELAKQAPFSLNELTNAFVKMKTGGVDPLQGRLQALTDAVASFGGTDEVLHRASVAIQQMAGKGVISMEELRQQLGEAVPNAINLMALSMGLSYRDLVSKISKGTVESTTALAKMFDEFERTFGGSSQRMMATFGGQLTVLKTNLTQLMWTLGGFDGTSTQPGGIMAIFGDALATLNDALANPAFIGNVRILSRELGRFFLEDVPNMWGKVQRIIDVLLQFKDVIGLVANVLFRFYIISSLIALMGRFLIAMRNATAGAGMFSVGMHNLNRAMLGAYVTAARLSTGMAGMTAAMRAAGLTVAALGRGFMALLGPIAFAVTAIWTIVEVLGQMKTKTDEASEAWDRFTEGAYNSDTPGMIREGAKSAAAELQKLRGELQLGGRINAKGDLVAFNEATKTRLKERLKELEEIVTNAEQRAGEVEAQLREDRATRTVQQERRALSRRIDEIRRGYRDEMATVAENLQKISNDETLNASQREQQTKAENERRIQIVKDHHAKITSAIEAELITAQRTLRNYNDMVNGGSTDSQMRERFEIAAQRVASLTDMLTEARENATAQLDVAETANRFISGGGGGGASRQVDKATQLIAQLTGRVQELKAELAGGDDETAKLSAMVNLGAYGEDAKARIGEILGLARQIDDLENKRKLARQDRDTNESLQKEYDQARIAAGEAYTQIVTGASDAEYATIQFKSRLDEMVGSLSTGKDEAQKLADAAVEAFTNRRVFNEMRQLQERTRTINTGLIQDSAARARAEADYEIEQIRKTLAAFRGSEEEKVRLAQIGANAIKAINDRAAEDAKSSFRRQLDDYTKVKDNMSQLGSTWLDNFTDQLVEGEFNFGEFVVSMLKDIAKLIIRALIAQAILSAIGVAQPVAWGGMMGGITGGAPAAPVPTAHTGGIAGYATAFKTVDLSVFDNARRYHGGGIAGLRPNEVPTILERGEGVFTQEQMAALGSGLAPSIQVNVINQSGQPLAAEAQGQRFDGRSYILDVVVDAANRPGKMRDTLRAMSKD